MKFRQMEVFRAIMLAGTVTGAAKNLNLSQPAVTKILRHTEDVLKLKLFHRIKGRLVPTDEALAILPDIEGVFQEIRLVQQSLVDIKSGRQGSLSIVAIPTLAQVVVPQAIAAIVREHPNIPIKFEVRPKRYVMQSIATGRAEVGFSFLAPPHPNVDTTPLCHGEMVCIMPRDHRLAKRAEVHASDLAGEFLVAYSKDQGLYPLVNAALSELKTRPSNVVEIAWVSTAWALVDSGIGLALVDGFSHLQKVYRNVAVVPFRPAIPMHADILTPSNKPLSIVARQFVRLAKEVMSQDPNG